MNAFSCISRQSPTDVYTLSLVAYAYSLYGRDVASRREVINQLTAKAVISGWLIDRRCDVIV